MYDFIKDKEYEGKLKSTCSDIINQLVQSINNEERIFVKSYLIGSGARNLITQNANEPVDLDYNIEIIDANDFNINDCRKIKDYIRSKFDNILNINNWGNVRDSTSVLTTEKMVFKTGNQTPFSIDVAILTRLQDNYYRLIHEKMGFVNCDRYYWNQVPKSNDIDYKVKKIKSENLWNEVRRRYLYKKNMYLTGQDYNHPSFIVYIETINEIYNEYFVKKSYDNGFRTATYGNSMLSNYINCR